VHSKGMERLRFSHCEQFAGGAALNSRAWHDSYQIGSRLRDTKYCVDEPPTNVFSQYEYTMVLISTGQSPSTIPSYFHGKITRSHHVGNLLPWFGLRSFNTGR
jgi:hypothetical protein